MNSLPALMLAAAMLSLTQPVLGWDAPVEIRLADTEAHRLQSMQPRLMPQRERDRHGHKIRGDHPFDSVFRKYTRHYFDLRIDWRWFRAQAHVESELQPDRRSRSGAIGLMQIMPRTAREIRARNPLIGSPSDPHHNIAAGIYYNRMLYEAWAVIPDEEDRMRLGD